MWCPWHAAFCYVEHPRACNAHFSMWHARCTQLHATLHAPPSANQLPQGLGRERPFKHSFDPALKSFLQVRGVYPVDAIVLPDIKMQVLELVLSTRPNNFPIQTDRKPRFEVDVLSMARKVSHQERRAPNFSNDLVIDLVCVL